MTMEETLAIIEQFIAVGGFHQIATANVDFLNKALLDPELCAILWGCDLTVADGMPLVWASRALGCGLPERVAGADLVLRLLALSQEKSYRIFLLGATPASLEATRSAIQLLYPGAVICGHFSPPFGPILNMENEWIVDTINATTPDILLVAFGNPKQEKWLAMHHDRLNVPACIGVGASFDFLSGKQHRAPRWMQELGLEWLHRLGTEPRRLTGRYVANAIFIVRRMSAQVLVNSSQVSHRSPTAEVSRSAHSILVKVKGDLNALAVQQIEQAIGHNWTGKQITLELSACNHVSATGMGWMLGFSNTLAEHGTRLQLASVTRSVRFAFRTAFPAGIPFDFVHASDPISVIPQHVETFTHPA